MTDPRVLLDTGDPIARITLNAPKSLNALDVAMLDALADVVEHVAADVFWHRLQRRRQHVHRLGATVREAQLDHLTSDLRRLCHINREHVRQVQRVPRHLLQRGVIPRGGTLDR